MLSFGIFFDVFRSFLVYQDDSSDELSDVLDELLLPASDTEEQWNVNGDEEEEGDEDDSEAGSDNSDSEEGMANGDEEEEDDEDMDDSD